MKLKPKNNFLLIPKDLVKNYLKVLGYSSFAFFIVLLHLSHRFSLDKFYRTDSQITEDYGLNKSIIKVARPKLKKLGFIDYKRGFKIGRKSRATRYILLPDEKLRKEFRILDRPKRANKNDNTIRLKESDKLRDK